MPREITEEKTIKIAENQVTVKGQDPSLRRYTKTGFHLCHGNNIKIK